MEQSLLNEKIILIVDDYQINTEILSLLTTDAGAISLTASNGKECLDIINNQHVDMIFMDTHMPVMDGIEATKAIRALPHGKDIVIIGVSGNDEGMETEACIQAGMNLAFDKVALTYAKLMEIAGLFFGDPANFTNLHAIPKPFTDQSNSGIPGCNADQPIMDYEKALNEFENDKDLLDSLIEDFNGIIHSQLIAMRRALEESDFECIRKESHGIKGGAANLCAMPISIAAKALETSCKQNAGREIISGLLEELAEEINLFEKFARSHDL